MQTCDILGAVAPSLRCSINNHTPLRGEQQATIYYDRRRCDELLNEEHTMIKSERYVCERCHQEYEWQARRLENGEGVKGSFEGFGNINVATADKVNGTYVIVGRCPHCGHHSLKNLYECEQ